MIPTGKPIRILYYEHPGPGVGGSRRSLLNLIRGLGDGICPYIVAELPAEVLNDLPKTAVVFPTSRLWPPRGPSPLGRIGLTARWLLYMVTTVLRLLWIILRRRIDIVHANNEVTSNAPAILAAKLARRPCVCHLRGESQPWRETRWLFRHVDRYIAISKHVRDFYAKQGLLRGRNVSIVYNGVDVQDLERRARREEQPEGSRWRVGMFGRMIEYKGHEFFIEVAARTLRRRADVEFIVHGPVPQPGDEDWPYCDLIHRRLAELGLHDHVSLAGAYTDVAAVMRDTDVVLCCSPYDNFGRILFEAMACGVPVVAFDVGGMAEVASDGVNCLLVPNRDTDAMADAVVRLLSDRALRERIIRGGRETASRLFDYRANASRVLALYRGQITSTSPAGIQGG